MVTVCCTRQIKSILADAKEKARIFIQDMARMSQRAQQSTGTSRAIRLHTTPLLDVDGYVGSHTHSHPHTHGLLVPACTGSLAVHSRWRGTSVTTPGLECAGGSAGWWSSFLRQTSHHQHHHGNGCAAELMRASLLMGFVAHHGVFFFSHGVSTRERESESGRALHPHSDDQWARSANAHAVQLFTGPVGLPIVSFTWVLPVRGHRDLRESGRADVRRASGWAGNTPSYVLSSLPHGHAPGPWDVLAIIIEFVIPPYMRSTVPPLPRQTKARYQVIHLLRIYGPPTHLGESHAGR